VDRNRYRLILLMGGPGAGKGTQARLLSQALRLPHVSSGDLLRARYGGTVGGMQRGDLVPDDAVAELVLARLEQPDAQPGAILDGFPRTLNQALALDRWLDERGGCVHAALYLELPADTLRERVAGRNERADDTATVAARRVDVFRKELPAILEHYAGLKRLYRIDGTQPVEQVHQRIIETLQRGERPIC
jgi:adenylate kinase